MDAVTFNVTLEAKRTDCLGYTTYVFKKTKRNKLKDFSDYLMCVRWPNWDHPVIKIGEEGFVTVRPVEAGVDKWYNGTTFVPYRYTNIIFISFLPKPEQKDISIKLD